MLGNLLIARKNRIRINTSFGDWIVTSLKAYGIEIIDLVLDIILTHPRLVDFHKDPADQLIAATSICKNIPLITFDRKLIDYKRIKYVKNLKGIYLKL